MTTDRPRVRLHDVHIEGAIDPAALSQAIEQAVAQSMLDGEPARGTADIGDAIRAEIAREDDR